MLFHQQNGGADADGRFFAGGKDRAHDKRRGKPNVVPTISVPAVKVRRAIGTMGFLGLSRQIVRATATLANPTARFHRMRCIVPARHG